MIVNPTPALLASLYWIILIPDAAGLATYGVAGILVSLMFGYLGWLPVSWVL